ncbi:MAG: hypothetical protein HQL20_09120 [Candidatus Omnitrophica bacterium]|nr:hypothetical protein [Candidatus Omnitrophota bacterium]
MSIGNILSALTFLSVVGLGLFFRIYLQKKAENLATKEDVADITKQVELVKASVGAKLYVHQVRYQNEFELLKALSEKLIDLRDAAFSLRPIIDSYDPKETKEARKERRYKEYHAAAVAFYKLYECNRPFYPDDIYAKLRELIKITRDEAFEYVDGPDQGGHDKQYWENATANSQKISDLVNAVIELMRARVKYWEEFKVQS